MTVQCLRKRKEEGTAAVGLPMLGALRHCHCSVLSECRCPGDDLKKLFDKSMIDLTRAGKRRGVGTLLHHSNLSYMLTIITG